nr:F0F1 ATP synthase subunit B' [Pontibaca salina]
MHDPDTASGLPQLDFSHFGNQIFWLVVTLVVIYLILSRVALPRIGAILAERQGTITNDIAVAEDLKAQALKAEEAYEKALADARAQAQAIVAETRAEIQAELDAALKEADAEIAARTAESESAIADIRAGAIEAVQTVATDTAEALVAAMGSKPDGAAIKAAVENRMKG